jgi:hypothetical protein
VLARADAPDAAMACTVEIAVQSLANILSRADAEEPYKDVTYAKESRASQDYWNGTVHDQSKFCCFSTLYKQDALKAGTFATRALQQGYRTYQFNSVGCRSVGKFNRNGYQLPVCPEWFTEWSRNADECLKGGRFYLVVWDTPSYRARVGEDLWKNGQMPTTDTKKKRADGTPNPDYQKDVVWLNPCRLEYDYAMCLKAKGGNVKVFSGNDAFDKAHAWMSEVPSAGEVFNDVGAGIIGGVGAVGRVFGFR